MGCLRRWVVGGLGGLLRLYGTRLVWEMGCEGVVCWMECVWWIVWLVDLGLRRDAVRWVAKRCRSALGTYVERF